MRRRTDLHGPPRSPPASTAAFPSRRTPPSPGAVRDNAGAGIRVREVPPRRSVRARRARITGEQHEESQGRHDYGQRLGQERRNARCWTECTDARSSTSAPCRRSSATSPTTPGSRRPRAARARSPTSTGAKACCCTAAIRSSSSPNAAASWRSATSSCTASCPTRRSGASSTPPSGATPWSTRGCGGSSPATSTMPTRWGCSSASWVRSRPSTTRISTSAIRSIASWPRSG